MNSSDDDSIFDGQSAHSGREIAEQLGAWPHGESADFGRLVGAVMTLALTVEQQARDIAERVRIGPLPPLGAPSAAQANAAHIAGDPSVRLATPEAQLELVYSGLAEIWRMASQREPYDQDSRFRALLAIEARCRAMLESAGRMPEAQR